MAVGLDDIRVLQTAEKLCDKVWRVVGSWNEFARNTVGKQLVRATDSVGANIAESVGRYNYGEKVQFLYYARGSLFETKYWLNRALKRGLLTADHHQRYCDQLVAVGRQVNAFVNNLKSQRHENQTGDHAVIRESPEGYSPVVYKPSDALITELDFTCLPIQPIEDLQSPISNL